MGRTKCMRPTRRPSSKPACRRRFTSRETVCCGMPVASSSSASVCSRSGWMNSWPSRRIWLSERKIGIKPGADSLT